MADKMTAEEACEQVRRLHSQHIEDGGIVFDVHAELRALGFVVVPAESLQDHYLPIPCPVCGRLRVEWSPQDKYAQCEKCGMRWPEDGE